MVYKLRARRQIILMALSLLFYLLNLLINLLFVLQFIAFWGLDTRCDVNYLVFITAPDMVAALLLLILQAVCHGY